MCQECALVAGAGSRGREKAPYLRGRSRLYNGLWDDHPLQAPWAPWRTFHGSRAVGLPDHLLADSLLHSIFDKVSQRRSQTG